MKIRTTEPVKYLGVEQKTAKKTGNPFTLVAFGDDSRYERHEFFLPDGLDVSPFEVGADVHLEFDVVKRGYNSELTLSRIMLNR